MKLFNVLRLFKSKNKKVKENKSDINSTLEVESLKLDKESHQKSEMSIKLHQNKIKKMNPDEIDLSNFKERKLTSIELNFLKYLNNVNVNEPNIASYWTYEYNIDYAEVLKQFLGQGLIEINDKKELENLKVEELRNILSTKGFPKSGRKADLIKRIQENFTYEELEPYIKDRNIYYKLTSKGKKILKNIIPSATKNIELEDKCYSLIIASKFNEAYKEIAKYESQKIISRGLGIDWENELKNGLSRLNLINYTDHLNLEQDLPLSLKKYQKQLNACVILGNMLGVSYDKILKLFQRICNVECDKQLIYDAIVSNCNYFYGKRDILSYLADGVENYKYVATLDLETCEKCASLNGKIFKVREAEFGVNFPPMCNQCRCTTVPYFEDSDYSKGTRIARYPITGKKL